MLVFDLALMQLNARENFIILIRHESFKPYKDSGMLTNPHPSPLQAVFSKTLPVLK
jgi:hypothetical protein